MLGPWRGFKPEVNGLPMQICVYMYVCLCIYVSVNVRVQDKGINTLAGIGSPKRRRGKERHLEKPQKANVREGMVSVHFGGMGGVREERRLH